MKHGGHVRGGLLVITPILSPMTSLEPPLPGTLVLGAGWPPGPSSALLSAQGLFLTRNCCFAPLGVQPGASEPLPCPCQV